MTKTKTISKQKTIAKSRISGWFDTLIVMGFTLPIYIPLLKAQFFWSHENAYFLWRLASFHQNVIAGMPFCRWFPDFARGLGLPFLEFYPALPLYISEVFKLSGLPVILSIKLAIVAITLFAAMGAYKLGNAVWGRFGGIITSVLFSYAPYKMLNLYVRGDINEYMALAGLPWALWIVYKTANDQKVKIFSLASISIFAIPALTHYPSCVIQYPVIFFWMLALLSTAADRKSYMIRNSLSLLLALIISSGYWLSAFMSRHLVQMENMTKGFADYTKQFIDLNQFFSFYWNFGASVLGPGDAISFQIGNFAFIGLLCGLPVLIKLLFKTSVRARAVQASVIMLIAGMFLMHSSSHWFWEHISVLPMLQFPYRILVIPALMISLLGGSCGILLQKINNTKLQTTSVLLIAVLIVSGSFYMCKAAEYMDIDADDLTPEDIQLAAHTHCTGEYIPKAVGKRFPPPKPVTFTLHKIPEAGFSREETENRLAGWLKNASHVETWEGGILPIGDKKVDPGETFVIHGNIRLNKQTGPIINRSWKVNAKTPGAIRINQFYFQGWSAWLDEESVALQPDESTGLIRIEIPEGTHQLHLQYQNLPLTRLLSWLGLMVLISVLIIHVREKAQQNV